MKHSSSKKLKPAFSALLVILVLLGWWLKRQEQVAPPGSEAASEGTAAILEAFAAKRSKVWVEAEGEVVHLLPDDRIPPRHQNFLVLVAPDHTVKISHNVDVAPKAPVRKGRRIRFRGRYEYNAKGGVVHWTHRDERGRKQGGWLEFEGQTYR